jgi:LysM repeat protein
MKRIILLLAFLIGFTIILEAQQKKYVSYTVKKGETLKSIAKDYKISSRDLRKLNPDVSRRPKANTVIIVPNKNFGKIGIEDEISDTDYYIVQPKETLFGISKSIT